MHRPFTILALVAMMATSGNALAQQGSGTFEKIANSGKVVVGVRESSAPMAYAIGAHNQFGGYHVELCERVLKAIVP